MFNWLLWKAAWHFADMIAVDLLYLSVTFINTVLVCWMEAIIRLKDKKQMIFKDTGVV